MVSVLLGLCRAMARFSPASEEFLFSRIHPNNTKKKKTASTSEAGSQGSGANEANSDTKMKGYNNFR